MDLRGEGNIVREEECIRAAGSIVKIATVSLMINGDQTEVK